jgi:hypothetical protein
MNPFNFSLIRKEKGMSESSRSQPLPIGPRARPHLFVCKGCPAYETEDWREPSGDGETYDTGQYAWCNAADRRSMGAYHYDHTPRPDWCPALPEQRGPTDAQLGPANNSKERPAE